MSVKIKELDKPELGHAKMKCDSVIHPKLEEYEMVKDCFSKTNYTVISAGMGYGKTSLCIQFMRKIYNKCFKHVFVFMPAASRRSIKDDIFGKYLEEENLFDDLTIPNLEYVYTEVNVNSENDEFSFILIDDFQEKYKNKQIALALEKFIISVRHLKTTVFLLSQNYVKIPKNLREIAQNLIVFNLGKSQLTRIFDECINQKKAIYDDIIHIAFKDKHDWICLNLNNSHKMYRMFDEIVLPEQEQKPEATKKAIKK